MNIDQQKKLVEGMANGTERILKPGDKFKFRCTGCGMCCFNIDVMVNGYDLIRLRNALHLSTQEILNKKYLAFHLGPSSGLPILTINFEELKPGLSKCPFLSPAINGEELLKKLKVEAKTDAEYQEKLKALQDNPQEIFKHANIDKWLCTVHKNRPIICRLFPCGRIQKVDKKTNKIEENYILQKNNIGCPGYAEDFEQSIDDFIIKQEIPNYKEGSNAYTEILFYLSEIGFLLKTEDNEKNIPAPMYNENFSAPLLFLANILFNFDSFNMFSKDERVVKTINDKNATHEDFMYVLSKINFAVKEFTRIMKKATTTTDLKEIANLFSKGGEKNG
jgi:Fe-S-cluster containining protein